MRRQVIFGVSLFIVIVIITAGCASTGRYQPEKFGSVVETPMQEALANIDHMMKNPQAVMQASMQKQQELLRLGEQLFKDPKTGNGKKGVSCSSCHPNGGTTGGEVKVPMRNYMLPIPSLTNAGATFPKYKNPNDDVIGLQQMNNNCIRMFMGGKRLPLNSPESHALAMYVASFSNGETVNIGRTQSESK